MKLKVWEMEMSNMKLKDYGKSKLKEYWNVEYKRLEKLNMKRKIISVLGRWTTL